MPSKFSIHNLDIEKHKDNYTWRVMAKVFHQPEKPCKYQKLQKISIWSHHSNRNEHISHLLINQHFKINMKPIATSVPLSHTSKHFINKKRKNGPRKKMKVLIYKILMPWPTKPTEIENTYNVSLTKENRGTETNRYINHHNRKHTKYSIDTTNWLTSVSGMTWLTLITLTRTPPVNKTKKNKTCEELLTKVQKP